MEGQKLTLISLLSEIPGGKIDAVKDLNLKGRNISETEDLGALKALEKINLSNNLLTKCKVLLKVV